MHDLSAFDCFIAIIIIHEKMSENMRRIFSQKHKECVNHNLSQCGSKYILSLCFQFNDYSMN